MLARPVRLVARFFKVAQLDLVAQVRDADDADLDDLGRQDAREAVGVRFVAWNDIAILYVSQSFRFVEHVERISQRTRWFR